MGTRIDHDLGNINMSLRKYCMTAFSNYSREVSNLGKLKAYVG